MKYKNEIKLSLIFINIVSSLAANKSETKIIILKKTKKLIFLKTKFIYIFVIFLYLTKLDILYYHKDIEIVISF